MIEFSVNSEKNRAKNKVKPKSLEKCNNKNRAQFKRYMTKSDLILGIFWSRWLHFLLKLPKIID